MPCHHGSCGLRVGWRGGMMMRGMLHATYNQEIYEQWAPHSQKEPPNRDPSPCNADNKCLFLPFYNFVCKMLPDQHENANMLTSLLIAGFPFKIQQWTSMMTQSRFSVSVNKGAVVKDLHCIHTAQSLQKIVKEEGENLLCCTARQLAYIHNAHILSSVLPHLELFLIEPHTNGEALTLWPFSWAPFVLRL